MPPGRSSQPGRAGTSNPTSDVASASSRHGRFEDAVRRLRAAGCVFAEEEVALLTGAAGSALELEDLLRRRAAGLPLEHLLGWAEFCGLRIGVTTGVFVPRRRTEFLVRQAELLLGCAVDREPDSDPHRCPDGGPHRCPDGGTSDGGQGAVAQSVVVDLCCGSGAVGAALLARAGGIELHASDLDPSAVLCARGNIEPAGGHVHEGDLFDPLPPRLRGRIAVLVANAPYVPTDAIGTMPPEARMHEPRISLDGGPDGLDIQRRVIAGSRAWLAPGGHVLIETSRGQARGTLGLMREAGLSARLALDPELDATVAVGTAAKGTAAKGTVSRDAATGTVSRDAAT